MEDYFTEPKIAQYPLIDAKDWFIWFRYNGRLYIVKKGINFIFPYEERLRHCEVLCEAIHLKLKSGWTPDNSKTFTKSRPIIECISDAMEHIRRNVSKNTFTAYSSTANSFVHAIKELKMHRMNADKFTRAHAKKCIDHIRAEKDWTNKNYNKNLGYIRSVFTEIVEMEMMPSNPFREIRNLKAESVFSNVPPSDEEMATICEHLKKHNIGLYNFYMVIYYCGIRPEELRELQVKHLDFDNQSIILPPEITKTAKGRTVPMLGIVPEILEPCKDVPPEYYVFGTWTKQGGRQCERNWFRPNRFSLATSTATRQWKKLIKDDLGINKTLYSAKHKGADDKLEAGMDKQTICDVFGHSDTKMTERYLHSLKNKRLDEARNVKMKVF